jgi:hypothetical protein
MYWLAATIGIELHWYACKLVSTVVLVVIMSWIAGRCAAADECLGHFSSQTALL